MALDKAIIDVSELLTLVDIRPEDTESKRAMFEGLIQSATSIINTFLGRDIVMPSADETELLSGDGKAIIFPKMTPIVDVTSLKVDNSIPATFTSSSLLVEDTDFVVFNTYIQRTGWSIFTKGLKNVQLIYQGGYDLNADESSGGMPYKIKLACAQIVMFMMGQRGHEHQSTITDEKFATTTTFRDKIPEYIFDNISEHRRWRT